MNNYSFKSPIVTIFGGTGFLGRYIVNRLAKLGYIINIVTRFPNEANFLKTSGNVGQINLVKGSFSNLSNVSSLLIESEVVINCVGILNELRNQKFKQIHTDAPEKLAILAKNSGVKKFIHISSIGADEKSDSKYSKSKGIGEIKILAAFTDAIILRPSIVFGSEDQFFNLFSQISCISPILPIVGGNTKFQPVYVDDIAKVVEKILINEKEIYNDNSSIYELGGPDIMSFHSLMVKMLAFIYRKRLIINLPFWLAKLMCPLIFIVNKLSFNKIPLLITEDSIKQLRNDNIVTKKFLGLDDFGIKPKSIDSILPSYLKHYRPKGNFSDL
ncbi:MAG: complex I NDUFA9 subunit family protein [Paracoccaceae bacterium]